MQVCLDRGVNSQVALVSRRRRHLSIEEIYSSVFNIERCISETLI